MLYIKALHIMAVVAWFSGIFYLPRLFVYHAMTTDAVGDARFCVMERKLYRAIMVPSAWVTLLAGSVLLWDAWDVYARAPWLHVKLFCVLAVVIYHLRCGQLVRRFADHRNTYTHIYYRVFNEIPVVFLATIVIMVVVKPMLWG